MPPAWNNNGYSQGTGSAAFLKGSNWGIYEGRMVAGIMGIGLVAHHQDYVLICMISLMMVYL